MRATRKLPLVPLAETVHERFSVEIFRGCTRGCRFCQAGMITRPVRERSIETIGAMVENGVRKSGFEEVGLLSLSSADHTEIGDIATGLADRYEGSTASLSLPSTRVDAFNITQDRISRSRLAGDPPDVMIGPKLARLGLFDFHRAEEATALVVNGFVKDVIQQLPMEFAVEAQKLIGIRLEGSVG